MTRMNRGFILEPRMKRIKNYRTSSSKFVLFASFVVCFLSAIHPRYPRAIFRGLKIALAFLLFHAARLVVIDDSALAFAGGGEEHFLDDFGQRGSGRLDGASKRVAAKRAEADDPLFGFGGDFGGHAVVVDQNQSTVHVDNLSLRRKVERDDRDFFEVDVLPNVELGPVRDRKDADALALADLAVVDVPQLGALVFGVPSMVFVAEGVDTFFGTRLFFVATGTAERGVELVLVERLLERVGLHDVSVDITAVGERADALLHAFFVDVDDQIPAKLVTNEILAERDHLLELPGRVDVHQRERRLGGVESLFGQPDHYGRIFADRVEHDRVVELGSNFADDMDALGFELLEVRKIVGSHQFGRELG